MPRAQWPIVVLILASLVQPGPAGAQSLSGLRVDRGGVDLLANPVVRKDLKLDDAQVDKVKALSTEIRGRQISLIASLEGLEGDERTKKARELGEALVEGETRAIGDLLKVDQLARFRQIALQERGASAMVDPKVAKGLDLSDEQTAQVRKLLDESILRRREAQSNTRGDRRASLAKIQALRKELDADAVALLNPEQRESWRRMVGEPIDLSPVLRAGR